MRVIAHVVLAPSMSPWDVLAAAMIVALGALYASGQRRMQHRGAVVRRRDVQILAGRWPGVGGLRRRHADRQHGHEGSEHRPENTENTALAGVTHVLAEGLRCLSVSIAPTASDRGNATIAYWTINGI